MLLIIAVLTLFAALMAADADAKTATATELIEKFSPILILTEDTVGEYGDIEVLKPEPVNIMGATLADNIWFKIEDRLVQLSDETWFNPEDVKSNEKEWDPDNRIKLLENKFAFFNGLKDLPFTATIGSQNMVPGETYTLKDGHFDFSGTETNGWDAEYKKIGENFPNTAYVHVYEREIKQYKDTYGLVVVIQYFYFYPYNDWWNNHEGDWQRIDVVVSSWYPETAEVLGVEYRFHGAWTNYYKDHGNDPGLTPRFVFNPQNNLKLSQGTHPVVYVGAGSHAGFPIGGDIKVYEKPKPNPITDRSTTEASLISLPTDTGDWEYLTHTGLVLSTQADGSHSDLWEPYDLVPLPIDIDNTYAKNMGLDDTLSWLGAQIRWGTPQVSGPILSLTDGNESPEHGPYNSKHDPNSKSRGWGDLAFFADAATGPKDIAPYSFSHLNYDYTDYHHWAIIGDETWSGTVTLYGDVVVFPGATLTIEAGTVVTFRSQSDRHQFLSATKGSSCLTEIFVYGSLISEGDSGTGNRVVFRGPSDSTKPDDWGGIHTMTGGVVSLGNYTDVLNGTPVEYAGTLTLSPNPPKAFEEVTATLTDPNCIIEDSVWWTYTYLSSDEQEAAASSSPTGYTGTTSVKKKLGTPLPTDVGKRLKVTAHYRDGLGPGKSASIESAPVVSEDPPFVEGLLDLVVKEYIDPDIIGPVDVGTYTNADPNPNKPVWFLIGADADEFNLVQKTSNANNERTLQFKQPPNYEVPLEGGGYKTTYDVGVKVTDTPVGGAVSTNGDALADTLLVTVTVTNVEEGGSVTLAPLPPEVGTATVAMLTDPDEGIVFTGARWTWQRRASETAAWESVSAAVGGTTDNYAELRSYTPVDADIGYQLRATVNYTDHHGPDKYAASDASPAVIAAVHRALAITEPESVSYAEHDTVAVGPYTITGKPGVVTGPLPEITCWPVQGHLL